MWMLDGGATRRQAGESTAEQGSHGARRPGDGKLLQRLSKRFGCGGSEEKKMEEGKTKGEESMRASVASPYPYL